MNNYLKFFFIINLFLYNFPCLAGLSIEDKLFIKSDSLTVNDKENYALFSGHVKVEFQDMDLHTTRLIVYYKKEEGKKDIDKIIIPEKLHIIKLSTNEIIVADQAEYIVNLGRLTLTGNVRVKKDNKIMVTDKMLYLTKIKTQKKK